MAKHLGQKAYINGGTKGTALYLNTENNALGIVSIAIHCAPGVTLGINSSSSNFHMNTTGNFSMDNEAISPITSIYLTSDTNYPIIIDYVEEVVE